MNNEEFLVLAEEAGFRRVIFLPYEDKTLILLLMPYPGAINAEPGNEAVISGYYPVSNFAYRKAKELSNLLIDIGYPSVSNIDIPLKPVLISSGFGDMGRNSLVSVSGLGSRFHIQTILTEFEFETTPLSAKKPYLADRCRNCSRCVQACPTGAILPDMHIDSGRCLRAASEMTPPPAEFRRLFKNRLLGCDICQDVCPVNKGLKNGDAPIVALKPLLDGDIEQMKQLIGVNYARKRKLRIKAAIIAANLKRNDLLPELEIMSASEDKIESEIAHWAIKEILEN